MMPSRKMIADWIRERLFNSELTVENDICLIYTDDPIEYGYGADQICFPDDNYEIIDGEECYTAGWGKNSYNGAVNLGEILNSIFNLRLIGHRSMLMIENFVQNWLNLVYLSLTIKHATNGTGNVLGLELVRVPINAFSRIGIRINSVVMICAGYENGYRDSCLGDSGNANAFYHINHYLKRINWVSKLMFLKVFDLFCP